MINALLIVVTTFLVLLALNYFSIHIFKLSKHKREQFRKISSIIYALFNAFCGVFNLIEANNPIIGWGQIVIGIALFFADTYDRKRKMLL